MPAFFRGERQPVDSMALTSGTEPALMKTQSANRSSVTETPRKESQMKALLIAIVGFAVLSLSACNTVEGAGKDVKATGQAVENAAKDSKPK